MKKVLLLFILGFTLTGLSMHAHAQGYFNRAQEGEIKFGIRGGVNYFNLGSIAVEGEDFESYEDFGLFEDRKLKTKYKIGFQVGGYADIWMSPAFSFMPEINVIKKGATLDEEINIEIPNPIDPDNPLLSFNMPFKLNTDIYYVEAPLLLGFKPAPSLTIFAGPQLSYLIYQKSSINGMEETEESEEENEFVGTEGLKKLIVGGAAGIRFDLTPNINIGARYATDFESAFEKDESLPKMRNSGISLSIGYTF